MSTHLEEQLQLGTAAFIRELLFDAQPQKVTAPRRVVRWSESIDILCPTKQTSIEAAVYAEQTSSPAHLLSPSRSSEQDLA